MLFCFCFCRCFGVFGLRCCVWLLTFLVNAGLFCLCTTLGVVCVSSFVGDRFNL